MKDSSSKTALGPTVQVAIEQCYFNDERLITDNVAYSLLPLHIKIIVLFFKIKLIRNILFSIIEKKIPGIRGGLICRKRYIDDKLIESINHNDIESVVILGAGFDTRAYRIPKLSTIPVFELDYPQNILMKRKHLKQVFKNIPQNIQLIPIDFNSQEIEKILLATNFTFNHKSFFILEGVTQYITENAFHKIFIFLEKAKPGSKLAFTYILDDFIKGKNMYNLDILYKGTIVNSKTWKLGTKPDMIDEILKKYNWNKIEDIGNAEYQERYIKTSGREMIAMEIERTVFASKK